MQIPTKRKKMKFLFFNKCFYFQLLLLFLLLCIENLFYCFEHRNNRCFEWNLFFHHRLICFCEFSRFFFFFVQASVSKDKNYHWENNSIIIRWHSQIECCCSNEPTAKDDSSFNHWSKNLCRNYMFSFNFGVDFIILQAF